MVEKIMAEVRTKVVEKCRDCGYIEEDEFCKVYYWPETKWTGIGCPMCTTTHIVVREEKEKKNLDPIKVSKRKMKGRQ